MRDTRLAWAGSLLAVALLAPPISAQVRAAPSGPVEKVGMLLGRWEGQAWIDMGPRGRQTLTQREYVTTAAGGSTIIVTGQGTMRLPDGTDQLVFDAFAVMYGDGAGGLAMRAFRKDGLWLDPTITPGERGLVWGFEDPRAGRIRYTMTMTPAGEWNEIGERSPDNGGTWIKFFEMTLQRIGD
jgi:hypothetical protein